MLHKKSGFRWNVQDRSALSMLIYAKLYNRGTFPEIERLNAEIKNLNNRYIILLPRWDVIGKRFHERGDEIQNLISLKKLYKLFSEAADEFESYPNVAVIRSDNALDHLDNTIQTIKNLETSSLTKVAQQVFEYAKSSSNLEATPLTLTYYDDGKFENIDYKALGYEGEKEYYKTITNAVIEKIKSELSGDNEYNRKETLSSRRFVYTHDSCISFAQFLFRNNLLDCHFVLRSSDVKNTLQYDIQFLYYLCSRVYKQLNLSRNVCRIRINFNSAHIII